MSAIGLLCKSFLVLASSTKIHGLEAFKTLLDERRDVANRKRGLLTVSNHLSVVDDPLIWGSLPLSHIVSPDSMRWSLGSADICFAHGSSSIQSKFFMLGQTVPTYRAAHSSHGGPFQPTMTQTIRLLSKGPFTEPTPPHPSWPGPYADNDIADPFSDPIVEHAYTTTGTDRYHAPSSFGSRRHAWVHVFPEGRIHQHPEHRMRYFKWGVARLILESEPCPDVVPMFVEGLADIMHEERTAPKWFPRWRKKVDITFGSIVAEDTFTHARERWKTLREKAGMGRDGMELNDELMYGKEAKELRIEVARMLRDEVQKLRVQRGYPDDDPKTGLWETWREEGSLGPGRKQDDSLVGDT